jgi:DNA (cytosine-5)-methyltransferase 1
MKSQRNIGLFSFFAGAGFLDLGFEATEHFQTLFVNEYHKAFMRVYAASQQQLGINAPLFGHHTCSIEDYQSPMLYASLPEFMKEARKKHDIIGFLGGPPCPDFSIAGKNKGETGENGRLSGTYISLICKTQPDFFLFENVKGLYHTKKHREFFDAMKQQLIASGYYLTEKLINAIEYGVPQDRERIILLGFRRSLLGDLGFVLNGSPLIKNFHWQQHTRYITSDVFAKKWVETEPFANDSKKPAPKNVPLELTVEHWFRMNNVLQHPNAEHHFTPRAGLVKFQTIPEGDDKKKSYKRLHRWRYSPTAAYGNNEVHLHPYKERRISVAEALAIQSLPKEYSIPSDISLTDMFKTIGNGVPYLAAKGLGLSIYDYLFNNPIRDVKMDYESSNSK